MNNPINKRPHYKIKRRYRLSFSSDNTFNELWSIKFSRVKVAITIILIIIGLMIIISAFIVGTPIRTLLPGYLKTDERNENIINTMRLDSLENEFEKKNAYYSNLSHILSGNFPYDSVSETKDSANNSIPLDSLMNSSEREKDFIKQLDETERYNLSVLAPLAAEGILFSVPVQGLVKPLNKSDKYDNGIDIQGKRETPVMAVYDGTIIDNYYTFDSEYNLSIQHPNGFISKYSHLESPFVTRGDKVTSGQRIATASSQNKFMVNFSLWHDGVAVNPQEFISF